MNGGVCSIYYFSQGQLPLTFIHQNFFSKIMIFSAGLILLLAFETDKYENNVEQIDSTWIFIGINFQYRY